MRSKVVRIGIAFSVAFFACAAEQEREPGSQEQAAQSTLEARRAVTVAAPDTRTTRRLSRQDRIARASATFSDPLFTFRTEPGVTNDALRVLYDLNQRPVTTSAAASAAWAARARAESTVAANVAEARHIILINLRMLDAADDYGYRTLAPLLEITGSDALIQSHLRALLLEPPPSPVLGHDVNDPRSLVRQTALGHLVGAAQKGDLGAKSLVLELVGSSDVAIQGQAVRAYYALSADRRLAQRTMRRLMAPSQYHLLYEN